MIDHIMQSEKDPVEFTADSRAFLARVAIPVYMELDRYDEAMAEYRLLADQMKYHSPNGLKMILAWIYSRAGDEQAARAVLESVPSDRRPRERAGVLAVLGEYDEAFDLPERDLEEEHVLWGLECLGVDPDFDAVRGDPRYIDLMERIGQPVGR